MVLTKHCSKNLRDKNEYRLCDLLQLNITINGANVPSFVLKDEQRSRKTGATV
jgi:hypothetical protein